MKLSLKRMISLLCGFVIVELYCRFESLAWHDALRGKFTHKILYVGEIFRHDFWVTELQLPYNNLSTLTVKHPQSL